MADVEEAPTAHSETATSGTEMLVDVQEEHV